MTLNHDREFVDTAEEADARRAARRISLIGSLAALILGFGLVSLLMYGPLSDSGVRELSPSSPVTAPKIPTPKAPAP